SYFRRRTSLILRMGNLLFAIESPPWAILWHYVTQRRSLPCPPAYPAGVADLLRNGGRFRPE
ncbi:MAG: hypothetical protein ABH839_03570, partial [Chloroflexota bacterium]